MRPWTAFAYGALTGAVMTRLARSLRPHQRTTLETPRDVPPAGSRAFDEELSALTHSGCEEGNGLAFFDGRHLYLEELFAALAAAEHAIWLEMFWWRDGRFAEQMTASIRAALLRGVHVRLMVDGFGADNGKNKSLEALRAAGADIAVYAPLAPYRMRRWNNRTHRRILIIDHQTAYVGGFGVDDHWLGDDEQPAWADVALRIRGPGVRRLAGVFADNWRITTGDPLAGAPALRHHDRHGDARVLVLHGGPDSGAAGLRLAMLYALDAAREEVRIVTPYFVPDRLMVDRLVACRQRGARVQLILPSRRIDLPIVRHASRATWGPLLRAGVEILEHQPTLIHTKALLIDGSWCLIGTMNVDHRSLRLNAEVAVGTGDAHIVKELGASMDRYVAGCVRVDLQGWKDRPLPQRTADRMAGLVAAQL